MNIEKELDKGKNLLQIVSMKNSIPFRKPSTKLEILENSLFNPTIDNNKSNEKNLLAKHFQSSSFVNNNVFTCTENRKNVLQRSISEKLRNSFKSNKQTNVQKRSSNFNTIEPRKWHSERYRNNNVPLIPNNFLVPKQLSSKQKSIYYTSKKSNLKNFHLKRKEFDSSDSENENKNINIKPITDKRNFSLNTESDTDSESLDENLFPIDRKSLDLDSDSDDSYFGENDISLILDSNSMQFLNGDFFDLLNGNEFLNESNYYERVLPTHFECKICYEHTYVNKRKCCDFIACNKCINQYIQSKIKGCCGNVRIECLNNNCNKLIHKDEIIERMTKHDKETLNLYLKLLIDANKNSNSKTCPRCSHVMTLDLIEKSKNSSLKKKRNRDFKKGSNLITKCQCTECQLIWCFQCHAPWHDGITCNEYKKSDRMLKYWAKEVHFGQQNAQLCPKCNIYIQRTKGCDHMVCPFCQNEFCYRCGKKFRSLKFIGDHYSKLSVLGCKYKLYPEKPIKRKFIRGSVLGAKIAAFPFVATAGLVAVVGALAVGCVALPFYGSYKLAQRMKARYRIRRDFKMENDESTGIDYITKSADTDIGIKKDQNLKESQEENKMDNLSVNL